MYIPKLHAYDAVKAQSILTSAHKSLSAMRATLVNADFEGAMTEEQIDEVKLITRKLLLTEFRASLEMDIHEEVAELIVMDGEPTTPAELSAFWSTLIPKVITPVLAVIPTGDMLFNPETYQPWTPTGLRALSLDLARQLSTARLDIPNADFFAITELDTSLVALVGTVDYVAPDESIIVGEDDAPVAPPVKAPKATVPAPTEGPKRIGRPPLAESAKEPRRAITPDAAKTDRMAKARAARKSASTEENGASEEMSRFWQMIPVAMGYELNDLSKALGMSVNSARNYTVGRTPGRMNKTMADYFKADIERRMGLLGEMMQLIENFL